MEPCTEPRKGLILHSGAIGDCLLTLPLAAFMKQACGLSQVHYMGRFDAIRFYPCRSGIDHIRPIESAPLHRLFEPQAEFALEDPDRLIAVFKGYEQIVSFLGAEHPDFENNLLMTVHCSHSAEVTMLPLAPKGSGSESISQFYIRSFAEQLGLDVPGVDLKAVWLRPAADDQRAGQDVLEQVGVNPDASVVIVHPGSGGRHKCWHPENFLSLAHALADNGLRPVFLFGPVELERFAPALCEQFRRTALVIAGLNLMQTFQLLTQADVFIGNDSGISHMAGAMGKKTHAIFGPTDSTLYRPLGPAVTIIQGDADGFDAPCPNEVARVLANITGSM
jgi:ADP-heptose:LPS heptosyltransferase